LNIPDGKMLGFSYIKINSYPDLSYKPETYQTLTSHSMSLSCQQNVFWIVNQSLLPFLANQNCPEFWLIRSSRWGRVEDVVYVFSGKAITQEKKQTKLKNKLKKPSFPPKSTMGS